MVHLTRLVVTRRKGDRRFGSMKLVKDEMACCVLEVSARDEVTFERL